MIEVRNVSMKFPIPRRFKDMVIKPFAKKKYKVALNSVSIAIERGDRVAFLGINGAGKTTLLKLIGGLLYATSGNITVNNIDTYLNNLGARKNVGFVLNEERSFYWRLTGIQNLEFFGSLENIGKKKLQEVSSELLRLVGLEDDRDRLVASYSSGMKQRLAIARGLLSNPEILVLDEPTRALDPQGVEDVKALLSKKIHENSNRTLLIATHRFDEAEELCNKVCIMRKGKILAYSTIEEIKSTYQNVPNYYHTIINGENI